MYKRCKSNIGNFLRCVLKYNSFSVNYGQMAGTEKNYKEHSGVSRGAALKRARGSNDIAVFVASRRVEDNRRASFFFRRFYFRRFECGADRPSRRYISAGKRKLRRGSIPLSLSSTGQLFHRAGSPCVHPVFIVWLRVSRNHK